MSEARNQRFEIDIEEIERQLRRSAEAVPDARPDPLAELARIVGQDDPFGAILGEKRGEPNRSNVHALNRPDPTFDDEVRGVLHGDDGTAQRAHEDLFDPVAETYGSMEGALQEDMQPLQPRRSRGRLAGVLVTLFLTTGLVAGGLYWRKSGGSFTAGGVPPVITADKTPLKVAPESPGGIDVPNQDRQIYERNPTEGQSRVVDGREQPVDVREAARNLPAQPTVSARAPVSSSQPGDPMSGPASEGRAPVVGASTRGSNAVANALGEPRRVRTVAVRPDGTTYSPTTTSSLSDALPSLIPGTLPPAIPVATVSVPTRNTTSSAVATAPAAASPVVSSETATSGPATLGVLPPPRPKIDARKPAAAEAPVRVAAVQADGTDKPEPAARRAAFSVQVAVRPSADAARTAYSQLQSKFAESLEGRNAQVTEAEVGGKTVHRVRVGPMTKSDATALCTKLKASGGSCFVAAN